MLYSLLKIVVRIAIRIFCRKIIVNKPAVLKESGPLLLACNHPNSFLDGVILDTIFEKPLHSLTRGDVFQKPLYIRLLRSLNLLPVYRITEGAENLSANYETFNACKDIFRKNGIVIIFSEGKCINEWHLRPLKKGTARLAIASWNENIPLRVLPVGINYSSFRRFGKNVFIQFGDIIDKMAIDMQQPEGMKYQSFNSVLEKQLRELVFEIDKSDKARQGRLLKKDPSTAKKIFLSLPATLGFLIHWPVYLPVKRFTLKRTDHNDHYDAVMTCILLFAYPIYLLLLVIVLFYFTNSWWALLLLPLLPFTAWSYVQLKPQLDAS
jgi:1-acyl-sn-glycerol-3-phosphate acyltransferase